MAGGGAAGSACTVAAVGVGAVAAGVGAGATGSGGGAACANVIAFNCEPALAGGVAADRGGSIESKPGAGGPCTAAFGVVGDAAAWRTAGSDGVCSGGAAAVDEGKGCTTGDGGGALGCGVGGGVGVDWTGTGWTGAGWTGADWAGAD